MKDREMKRILWAVKAGKFVDKARLTLTGRVFKERRFVREVERLTERLERWERKGG